MGFSVNVLAFGDYPDLARRCFGGVFGSRPWGVVDEVRVALNRACTETRDALAAALEVPGRTAPVVVFTVDQPGVGKYPIMRRMLYSLPVRSDRVMWFDDDSYVRDATPAWWERVHALALAHTMLGSRWFMTLRGSQWQAIQDQPWYTGQPKPPQVAFRTGGWWTADPHFLRRWDYPFPELYHRGGDVILGELCRQQHARVLQFNEGVSINAWPGDVESSSPRRGIDTPPLWHDYVRGAPVSLAHHVFEAAVTVYPGNTPCPSASTSSGSPSPAAAPSPPS